MEPTQAPEGAVTEQPAQTSPAGEQPGQDSQASQGQAESQSGQADGTPAHSGTEEDSFFDPKQLPPELLPAYKQMQKSYTKRMQGISTEKQKIEAYNAFSQDPVGTLRQVAKQYGLDITQAGQAQPTARTQPQPGAWEPQSWDEVMERAQELAEQRILGKLGPVIQSVQEVRASNIEKQLDEVDPNWREYEDDMRQALREHPTLAKDAAKLYRLSVPGDVQEQKAVQIALRRLESKTKSAQAGAGASQQQVRSTPAPAHVSSFQDAVEEARKQLARQGR